MIGSKTRTRDEMKYRRAEERDGPGAVASVCEFQMLSVVVEEQNSGRSSPNGELQREVALHHVTLVSRVTIRP